jgi:hypothetical protein
MPLRPATDPFSVRHARNLSSRLAELWSAAFVLSPTSTPQTIGREHSSLPLYIDPVALYTNEYIAKAVGRLARTDGSINTLCQIGLKS